MSKIYFIDSENVGDSWISLLSSSRIEDKLLVFYTAKSPHMNYKNVILLKESDHDIVFIECSEGNNALDFQLVSELGYRIRDIGDDEFVIVSNDTGFDAAVKYWNKQLYKVTRINSNGCTFSSKPATPITEFMPVLPQPSVLSDIVLSEPQASVLKVTKSQPAPAVDNNAKEILYLVGKNNLQQLHESLQQLYGTKAACIYNAFKSDTAYNTFLAKHPVMNLAAKQRSYCSIVFSISAPQETMPSDFPNFIMESWHKKRNLNSLKSLITQKYGKANGERYYSLFKIHIKILDKIK